MNNPKAPKGTNIETLKILGQSILRRLESQKMIAVFKEQRDQLVDTLAQYLQTIVRTQEDMESEVLGSIGEKNEELNELHLSGGEAYRALRQQWLSKHGEYEVDGLYFQEPIKYIAEKIIKFLFKTPEVEEIFSDDKSMEKTIVATIGGFRRSKLR